MAEGEDGEREVLTSLPRTRPVRRSAKRAERGGTKTAEAKPATSRAKATPRRPPAEKASPTQRAEATPKVRPKAAPKQRAKPASKGRGAAAKPAPKPRTRGAEAPHVAPQRKVPPAGYAAPTSKDGDSSPGATEILVTAVQAATELAQIGFSVGRQALQSALERLPKP